MRVHNGFSWKLLALHFNNKALYSQESSLLLLCWSFWQIVLIKEIICPQSMQRIWVLSLWHVLGTWPPHYVNSSRQLIRGNGFSRWNLARRLPHTEPMWPETFVTSKVMEQSKPNSKANYDKSASFICCYQMVLKNEHHLPLHFD